MGRRQALRVLDSHLRTKYFLSIQVFKAVRGLRREGNGDLDSERLTLKLSSTNEK